MVLSYRLLLLLCFLSTFWRIAPTVGQSNCCENLIPNGSFENFAALPNDDCDWFLATGWTNAATTSDCGASNGTPDYYHLNGQGNFSALPDNYFATNLLPADGSALMGVASYLDFLTDAREYLSIPLNCPLAIGDTYTFSFAVTQASPIEISLASNNLGVLFSQGPVLQQVGCNCPIQASPQFNITEIVSGSDWQYFTYTFTADRPYDFFTFGNFFDDANTQTQNLGIDAIFDLAYYFVDDFSLYKIEATGGERDRGEDQV
ncbi:MAG: hypothetical protein AAFP19_26525, partial [Bacteroidota bacterium]